MIPRAGQDLRKPNDPLFELDINVKPELAASATMPRLFGIVIPFRRCSPDLAYR